MHEESAAIATVDEPRPNPYVWDGDHLIHQRDGHLVAHVSEFPQIVAAQIGNEERWRRIRARDERLRRLTLKA